MSWYFQKLFRSKTCRTEDEAQEGWVAEPSLSQAGGREYEDPGDWLLTAAGCALKLSSNRLTRLHKTAQTDKQTVYPPILKTKATSVKTTENSSHT